MKLLISPHLLHLCQILYIKEVRWSALYKTNPMKLVNKTPVFKFRTFAKEKSRGKCCSC